MKLISELVVPICILFPSFALPVVASIDTQRCYYGAGMLASDKLIPCYTSTSSSEIVSCCQLGHKCLGRGACYDPNTGVTYQYGCTDPLYMDERCATKCHYDLNRSPWIGLVYCNGTNGMPNNTWLCHHPENCGNRGDCATRPWGNTVRRIVHEQPVACKDLKHDEDKYVAFKHPGTIPDVSMLPEDTQTASWWLAHADQTKMTVSTPFAGSPSSSSATTTPTSNPISSPAPASASSHKLATTIGLGVGLGIGIPLLLGIAALLFLCIRRQRREKAAAAITPSTAAEADHPSPPAYGYHDDKKHVLASHGHVQAELDGTPNIGSPGPSEMQDTSVVGSPVGSPAMGYDGFRGTDEIRKAEGGKMGDGAHEMAG